MPSRGYFPDFLTPAEASGGLECGIDAVLATPRRRLRTELGLLSARNPLPHWARQLADGEASTLHLLGRVLREYHASVLEPAWRDIASRIEGDRRHRTETQCRLGTEEMLRTFAPVLRWQSPVLSADYPVERDVHLQGRGLLLVPSYFCRHTPVALLDEALWPVLVYPLGHQVGEPDLENDAGASLADLVGSSRAAVLEVVGEGSRGNTGQLARRVGLLLSSTSQHLAVLRHSGLVVSTREGNSVLHEVTPLGAALLRRRL
ncbi:ArsR/SmtB family transcription factor [Streptomyces physcomitrii]|nr:DUF5937 family protein [Streptomyces physcomitrii]